MYFNYFRHLVKSPGFTFEARSKEYLPSGFPVTSSSSCCYFLLGFRHPNSKSAQISSMDHIQNALNELNEQEFKKTT